MHIYLSAVFCDAYIDGLEQDCSITLAMVLQQSCTKASISRVPRGFVLPIFPYSPGLFRWHREQVWNLLPQYSSLFHVPNGFAY